MGRGLILCVAGCLIAFSACQKQTDELTTLQETSESAKKPVNIIYFNGKLNGGAGISTSNLNCFGVQSALNGNGKAGQLGNFTFTTSHCEGSATIGINNTMSIPYSDGTIALDAKNGTLKGFYMGQTSIDATGKAVVDMEIYFDGGTGKYENAAGYAFASIPLDDLINKNFTDASFNGGISH